MMRWLLLGLALCVSPVLACRFQEPPGGLSGRLERAQTTFVGVVSAVTKDTLVFDVEIPVKGEVRAGQTYSVPRLPSSTCVIEFEVGGRWFFAGQTIADASVGLGRKEDVSAQGYGLLRQLVTPVPDEALRCSTNQQCTFIQYGCATGAVNVQSKEWAEKRLWREHGDPSAIRCASLAPSRILPAALCVKQKCSAWLFDFKSLQER